MNKKLFFDLPSDILGQVYMFDNTYKHLFDNTLKQLVSPARIALNEFINEYYRDDVIYSNVHCKPVHTVTYRYLLNEAHINSTVYEIIDNNDMMTCHVIDIKTMREKFESLLYFNLYKLCPFFLSKLCRTHPETIEHWIVQYGQEASIDIYSSMGEENFQHIKNLHINQGWVYKFYYELFFQNNEWTSFVDDEEYFHVTNDSEYCILFHQSSSSL